MAVVIEGFGKPHRRAPEPVTARGRRAPEPVAQSRQVARADKGRRAHDGRRPHGLDRLHCARRRALLHLILVLKTKVIWKLVFIVFFRFYVLVKSKI